MFLNSFVHRDALELLLKMQTDLVGLAGAWHSALSNKLSGEANAAGLWTILFKEQLWRWDRYSIFLQSPGWTCLTFNQHAFVIIPCYNLILKVLII